MDENKQVGFVNGQELKKGDKVQYQITRLAGVNYDPPIIHEGEVVNVSFGIKPKHVDWVVQIRPKKYNERVPDYDFSGGVWAIYGKDIIGIVD